MKLEIVTVGDELLLGFTTDTNAVYLARALASHGVEVVRRATVGDDADAIAAAVREALERTGAVITTGGLGPTADDLTKPAIAAVFGRRLEMREEIVAMIEARFRTYGFKGTMPEANRQQALVPEGARVLDNRHGTAPGIWLEDDAGRWVAMLPGVPRELRGMTDEVLVPLLRERAGTAREVVRSRTLRCVGIGESHLADLLGGLARAVNGLPLAYIPTVAGIDVRLTARGMSDEAAAAVLDAAVRELQPIIAHHLYGEDEADLAEVVLALCRDRSYHIAVAESCTGGLLGARLTSVPGSSDVFRGGVIAYDDDVKVRQLGADPRTLREHGAVSEQVAREMVAGVTRLMKAEVGIAITGVAGPGGGTPEKPVGFVWLAVAAGVAVRTHHRVYPGDRQEIRERATQAALDLLRRMLT
ncbi:MAG: competence/damage-inducible protein A [Gemmatimonadaceae bacterium]